MLQDNIILCDGKSGVLLAFDGAMVIFCIDAFVAVHKGAVLPTHATSTDLFLLAGAGFLVSSHFSLSTVLPSLRRGVDDHIFWEAPIFSLPVEVHIDRMEALEAKYERREKLQHLHLLAGICRNQIRPVHPGDTLRARVVCDPGGR